MKSCKGKRCHLRFFIFIPFTLATKMFMERMLLSSIKGSPNDNDKGNYCVLPEYHKCVLPPLT